MRCRAPQVVFVQTPLLTAPSRGFGRAERLKYRVARALFRRNCQFSARFIVQTTAMKDSLEQSFPAVRGKVQVVGQPVPNWLSRSGMRRRGRQQSAAGGLDLIYPAASYPHKNHRLLSQLDVGDAAALPIRRLVLTIESRLNPNPRLPWISCTGIQTPDEMVIRYGSVDGLLFLSSQESYGFPLVEAMWVGLPIICPDLPYARTVCGSEALYFDPERLDTLRSAVRELHMRLVAGWWPDWRTQLRFIPSSWQDVADMMMEITAGARVTDCEPNSFQ